MDYQRHQTESEQREADFITRGEADKCEETVVATGHQMQDLAADDDLTRTFCAITRRNVKALGRVTRLAVGKSASIDCMGCSYCRCWKHRWSRSEAYDAADAIRAKVAH